MQHLPLLRRQLLFVDVTCFLPLSFLFSGCALRSNKKGGCVHHVVVAPHARLRIVDGMTAQKFGSLESLNHFCQACFLSALDELALRVGFLFLNSDANHLHTVSQTRGGCLSGDLPKSLGVFSLHRGGDTSGACREDGGKFGALVGGSVTFPRRLVAFRRLRAPLSHTSPARLERAGNTPRSPETARSSMCSTNVPGYRQVLRPNLFFLACRRK